MPPRTRGRLPLTDKTLTINIPKPKRAMARRQAEQPKSNICIVIPQPPARKPTPTTAAEIAAAFRATAKASSTAGEEKEKEKQPDEGIEEGKLGAEAMRRPGPSKTKAPSLKANSSFSIVIPKLQSSARASHSLKHTPTGQSSVESYPSGFRATSNASSAPAPKPQSPEHPVHEEALSDNELQSNYNSESLEYLRVDSSSSGSESPPRAADRSLGDPFDELPAPPSANLPERFSNEDYEIPLPPSSQPRKRNSPLAREETYSDASEDDPFGFGSADRRVKAMKAGGVLRKPVVPAAVQLPTPRKPAEEDEEEDEDEKDEDEDEEEEADMEDDELPEVVFQKPKPTRKTRPRKRKSYNEDSEDNSKDSNSSEKEAPARRGRKAKGKAKASKKSSIGSRTRHSDYRRPGRSPPQTTNQAGDCRLQEKRSSWVLESDDDEEEDKTDYDEDVPAPSSRVVKKSKSSRSAVTEKGNKKQGPPKTTSGPSKFSKASAKPPSRLKAPRPPSSTDEDVREARTKRIKLYKELDADNFEEELVL